MADIKTSSLPATSAVNSADVLAVVQGGVSKKATIAQVVANASSGAPTGDATATSKGIVQLTNDLSGTAASPTLKQINSTTKTYGSATKTISPTIDTAGRVISVTEYDISASGSGAVAGWSATDHVIYCTLGGSDSNDGLSPRTAVKTAARAKQLMDYYSGVIQFGYGVFPVDPGVLTMRATQRMQGINRMGGDNGGTALDLQSSGTLLNWDGQTDPSIRDLSLRFASASVTGTLLSMSGTFTATVENVGLVGTGAAFKGNSSRLSGIAAQVGMAISNNTGDCKFSNIEHLLLGIGTDNQSTISTWTACNWTSCLTAMRGGDTSGNGQRLAGATIKGGTMRGWGNYYLDAAGTSQSWDIDGIFFDGQADTAVRLGYVTKDSSGNVAGYGGPWSFTLYSQFLSGAAVDLEANACINTVIQDGLLFGDSFTDGTHPTAVLMNGNATTLPQGRLGRVLSLRGPVEGQFPTKSGWDKTTQVV